MSVFREDFCQPKHSTTSCWSSREPVGGALLVTGPVGFATLLLTRPPVNVCESWRVCAVSHWLCAADGCVGPPLYRLQALVPKLLRHEVEVALEKLSLTWDRTYAWDMFLHMMVRPCPHSTIKGPASSLHPGFLSTPMQVKKPCCER